MDVSRERPPAPEGLWPDKTIWDYLTDHVARHPHKVALVDYDCVHFRKRGQFTYAQLLERALNLALGFRNLGIKRGDRVLVQLPNWHELVLSYLALAKIGAIIVPLPATYRSREVGFVLGITRAVMAIIPLSFRNFDYPHMIHELRPELPNLKHLLVVGERKSRDFLSFWEFMDRDWSRYLRASDIEGEALQPDEVAQIIFTSGTTARLKGAIHTSNTTTSSGLAVAQRLGLTSDDVWLSPSPFGHSIGFVYGMHLPLSLGAKLVSMDYWDPSLALKIIEEERVSFSIGTTPFLLDLTRCPSLPEHDLSSLRLFRCGGAPIPRSLVSEAYRTLGVKICAGWGLTETGTVTLNGPDDPAEKVYGTDGYPLLGVKVKVMDREFRKELGPGVEGELVVQSYSQMKGYWEEPQLTRDSFTRDGWFKTGDRGVMDEEGYVRITGRSKDIILRGGVNIPVAELEDLLHQHPQIARVAIVGMPDTRLGERVCAYVVPREGEARPTLEDIVRFLQGQGIATHKLPERLEVVKELPVTPAGKVQKHVLRQMIAEKLEREAGMQGKGTSA